jgi:hypothetical protein
MKKTNFKRSLFCAFTMACGLVASCALFTPQPTPASHTVEPSSIPETMSADTEQCRREGRDPENCIMPKNPKTGETPKAPDPGK